MADEHDDGIQRWTAKRRAALVLSIMKGETSIAEAARRDGLTVAEIEDWRERFLVGAENALRSRPKDEAALKESRLKSSHRRWASWSSTTTSYGRPCVRTRWPGGRPTSEAGPPGHLTTAGLCDAAGTAGRPASAAEPGGPAAARGGLVERPRARADRTRSDLRLPAPWGATARPYGAPGQSQGNLSAVEAAQLAGAPTSPHAPAPCPRPGEPGPAQQ